MTLPTINKLRAENYSQKREISQPFHHKNEKLAKNSSYLFFLVFARFPLHEIISTFRPLNR